MKKTPTVQLERVRLRDRIVAGILIASIYVLPQASGNPQGGQVRQGQVRISSTPGQVRIHQQSQRAVIDWESFSIGAGESTRFIQPNSSAAALNRVRGDSASRIEGMLRANGRVYLINPNGILIGPDGRIDVGGFVASTLDTSDGAFKRGGSLRFSGDSDAAIVNLGAISALDGDVVLMAGSVSNEGTIRASRGSAALAAGNDILLSEGGEERVFVRGSGGPSKATGVSNTGKIEANIAELKAHGGNVYGIAVKNEGRVAATGVTRKGGQIFLSAGGGGKIRNTGTLKAKAKSNSGGRIKVDAGKEGRSEIGGIIDASSMTGAGGEITILGNEIEIVEGTLIVNDGATAGGITRIGGGQQGLDPDFNNSEMIRIGNGAIISADATQSGNGGEIIVFSKGSLTFDGHLSVAGASGGSGGFAELSGQREVYIRNLGEQVDLGAASGMAGTLLLDPIDIDVIVGANDGLVNGTVITDGTINHFLTIGNLAVNTSSGTGGNGDITFAANTSITWSTGNNLSFTANRDIIFQTNALVNASGAGSFSATAARQIKMAAGSAITVTDGGVNLTANNSGTATGSFSGIDLDNSLIQSNGIGSISLTGRGGTTGADQHGVRLRNGADILGGTTGLVSVTGFGGSSQDQNHQGIILSGSGTSINSTGADIELTGTGGDGSLSSGIYINGASVGAGDLGNLKIEGNGGNTVNGAFLHGIYLYEATVNTAGGNVELTGYAGTGSSATGDYTGVHLDYSTVSAGGDGTVSITGTGGSAVDSQTLIGVDVRFSSQITSSGGNVTVFGTGGNTNNVGVSNGAGVRVIGDGIITSGGSGAVTVTGIGVGGTSVGHEGVVINGSGLDNNLARIGAANGETTITATSGNDASHALVLGINHAGRITSGTNNPITINADSISIGSEGILSSGGGNITILTRTNGTRVDLGGADVLGGSPLTLGLTNAELARISAGTLLIGNNDTGSITVSNTLNLSNNLSLLTGQGISFEAGLTMAVDRDLMAGAAGPMVLGSNGSITSSGTGDVAIDAGGGVRLEANAFISTVDGTVFLYGNADGTTEGQFQGIYVGNGASITTGTGQISLTGKGGDGPYAGNHGIFLDTSSLILSTGGNIELNGTGIGAFESNSSQEGIVIQGDVQTEGSGSITIVGRGGNATAGNLGVNIFNTSQIVTEYGNIDITGTSGGGLDSPGIQLADFGDSSVSVRSTGGNITIKGENFDALSPGILAFGFGVSIGGGTGDVTLESAGTTRFFNGASISTLGSGAISLTSERDIRLEVGSSISSVDGDILLSANQQSEYDIDDFTGVFVGGAISTTGTGSIDILGRGAQGGVLFTDFASATTAAGNLTITGRAIDEDSIGIEVQSGSIAANGGLLRLSGTGYGAGNAVKSGLSGQIGSGNDPITIESNGGDVQMDGMVFANRLLLLDQTGNSNVDFVLGNSGNRIDQIGASGSGSLGAVGSLFYRDSYSFETADFFESGYSIKAKGDVSLRSEYGNIYHYSAIESDGGDILLEGDFLYLDADLSTTGTGSITATATRGLSVNGADITSEEGDIQLNANANPASNLGSFIGLSLYDSTLSTGGEGSITLRGNGGFGYYGEESWEGDDGPELGNIGVLINELVTIETTGSGSIEIVGNGGDWMDLSAGIWMEGEGISVTTANGNLSVTGFGGGLEGGTSNRGILINDSLLSAGGSGNLTIHGTGGSGDNEIDGVQIGSGSMLEVSSGDLSITGIAGGTLGIGVMITENAGDIRVLSNSPAASIAITGTGTGASGVNLGNPSAILGSHSSITADIEVTSLGGNVVVNRAISTGGSVMLKSPANLQVSSAVTGGSGGVSLDATNITLNGLAQSNGGEVSLTFGQNAQSGTATVNLLPQGTAVSYMGRGPDDVLDLSGLAVPAVIGIDQLDAVENVLGNGLAESVVRAAVAGSSFTISGPGEFSSTGTNFTGFQDIAGDSGDDSFLFTGNGSILGNIDGAAGSNSIDYSGYGGLVTLDLASGSGTGIGGGFTNIGTITGSAFDDVLFGPVAATTYEFSGPNQFQAGTLGLLSFENLNAGPLADVFTILPGGSLSGILDGGGGVGSAYDTLDYSLYDSTVEVNLGITPLPLATALSGGFRNIENFVGSAATNDQFIGGNTPNIYRMTGLDGFDALGVRASGFENLRGGTALDTFLMLPGAFVSGLLEGGEGTAVDSISYALYDRPVTVNIGPNTAPGITNFAGFERIRGSRFNDRFIYLNQNTIGLVDGGPGDDTVVIDDRDLGGQNTYYITAGGISRNPSYPITGIETVRLFVGDGGNTINSGFYRFGQVLTGGSGADSLNLPGVTSLDGGNQIGNVRHSGFEAPRPLDTGDILKQEVDSNDVDQGNGDGNQYDNRNNTQNPGVLASQIGAIGGAFSASIISQAIIVAVDGNSYLVFRPISLDGSGLTPSNLALTALQQSLGVDANLELASAIGYGGPIFLTNPDGAYALDLSGAPVDPALLAQLQGHLTLQAISELSQALGLALSITINLNDGAVAISLDGGVPGQQVSLVLSSHLDAAALAELNAALGL